MSSDTPKNNDSQDGTDTPTTEWFGQSVDSDAELAEKLAEENDDAEAEKKFDEQSKGQDVEDKRRGDEIDPDLGQAAYQESDPDHAAETD